MNTVAADSRSTAPKPRNSDPFGNLGRVRRVLAPAVERPFALVESAVFMALVLALCWALDRHDPLLLGARFPWLWLAPLIVALRYGALIGTLGGAMMIGMWYLCYPAGEWPMAYFAGGLIQTIVAGHFGDTWGTRATRSRSINAYLNDRLVAITDSHYLLRLSHERLEKDLLSKPTTLRDSITELRRLTVTHAVSPATHAEQSPAPTLETLPGAQRLLEFVAQACQIEVAALYPVTGGKPALNAVAAVGEPFEFDAKDDLVTHALTTQSVAHLRVDDSRHMDSRYIVCAPMLTADNELRAVLVVKRMPFLSLNADNLLLLLVLLGYYADGIEHSQHVQDILDAVPECPYEFALELGRLAHLQQGSGIESSLVALSFPRDDAHDSLFEHVMRRRRSLDIIWPLVTDKRSVLVNLMPVTDATGIDGYLARIEGSLAAQFDTDLEQAGIGVHTLHVHDASPGPSLAALIARVTSHV
ncbi:PelD GGDEF domain-containing protein [Trinickia sp. YCB016]